MKKTSYLAPEIDFLEMLTYSLIAASGDIEDLETGEEIPWI